MGQLPNYYLKNISHGCKEITQDNLDKWVIQHLKSTRINRDETISFLNGAGLQFVAKCTSTKPWSFEIIDHLQHPLLTPKINLILSPPKLPALQDSIAKACEIGVNKIYFLRSQHCQWPQQKNIPVDKLEKNVVSALEQCGRPWDMALASEWLDLDTALNITDSNFFADESLAAKQSITPLASVPQKLSLFIGPEGGWSPEEKTLLDSRSLPLSLGELVLRVPTAIVAASFLLRFSAQQNFAKMNAT